MTLERNRTRTPDLVPAPEGRPLPVNIDAERHVLGALLLDREAVLTVTGWLRPGHFSLAKHEWIYDAVLACHDRRIPADIVTVAEELRRQERLEHAGGLTFLGDLMAEVPTAVHIEYYARIVEQAAVRRELIDAGARITALAYDERDDVATMLARAEDTLHAIGARRESDDFEPITDVVDRTYREMTARQHGDGAGGIATGFPDLDERLSGLQRQDLILLAARPSVGKTSLALALAANAAARGARVGIVSAEMSSEALVQRLTATRAGVDLQRLRMGTLSEAELDRVLAAMGAISDLPMVVDASAGATLGEIRARARRLHHQHGLDLLIVDYLQLLALDGKSENRVQEVSAISRGLKRLAGELNVPLLALSQLSRAVESRSSRVPLLSDLRDSGALEQDADVVLFLYREELYDPASAKKGTVEVHIAKHRNGPTGVVPLGFDAATTGFRSLERYRTPEGW